MRSSSLYRYQQQNSINHVNILNSDFICKIVCIHVRHLIDVINSGNDLNENKKIILRTINLTFSINSAFLIIITFIHTILHLLNIVQNNNTDIISFQCTYFIHCCFFFSRSAFIAMDESL